MSRTLFIILLCAYGLFEVFGILANKRVRLPEHVERAKPDKAKIFGGKSKLYCMFMLCATILVSISGIVGFVGMFFFWKAAPWFFGFGIFGKAVFNPKALWSIRNGWENTFAALEEFLGGIIFALAFFGIAK